MEYAQDSDCLPRRPAFDGRCHRGRGAAGFPPAGSRQAVQRERLLEHSTWMRRVENGILLSGSLARDYSADPHGADGAALLARLSQVEGDTRQAMAKSSGIEEELRGEVSAYWQVLDFMLEMARKQATPDVDAYFRRQLSERRESMLHLAGEIERASDSDWRQGEARLSALYGRLRWILGAEMALVVGLGLVLSVGAARRLLQLEGETRSLSAQLERAKRRSAGRSRASYTTRSGRRCRASFWMPAAPATSRNRPWCACNSRRSRSRPNGPWRQCGGSRFPSAPRCWTIWDWWQRRVAGARGR